MTQSPLETLRRMTYPGRGILLGLDPTGERRAVAYFVTGRSPSSQARRLVREGDTVWTKPTDPEALKKGNPELLIYPAVIASEGLAVSNGRQTTDIAAGLASGLDAGALLERVLERWDYEPDAPIFTPRISGCVTADGGAALSLVSRSEDGATVRRVYGVPSDPGGAALLTTYGGDPDSVRPFPGPPLQVRLESSSAGELAEAVYEALASRAGAPDYRVAVVGMMTPLRGTRGMEITIINRKERTRDHG